MMPRIIKPEASPKEASLRNRKLRKPRSALEKRRVWWMAGATTLSVAYIVASQALVDLAGWSLLAVAFAVLLAGLLACGSAFLVWEIRFEKWMWVPAVFLAYCVLRSFSAGGESKPFDVLFSLASAFLGGIAIATALQTGVRFRWIVYAQVASNLIQILIILFGLGPEPDPGEDTFRYAGITGNANQLALQLTLGACMIWLLPRKSGLIPCGFAFAAVAFALAVTGSRKAVLIAFFFLVLVMIQAWDLVPRRKRRVFLSWAIGAPCLLGLLLSPLIWQHAKELVVVQRTVEYDDSSYRTRAEMIQQGIQFWRQAPLFGNGTDAFRSLSGKGTYSHNNYVELLCDLGILGVTLFYALHAQVVVHALRVHRTLKISVCIFIGMMVLADIGYVSYNSKQAIMILMLLMAVTTSRYAVKPSPVLKESKSAGLKGLKFRPRRFVMNT
jgi:O-antigen ligase